MSRPIRFLTAVCLIRYEHALRHAARLIEQGADWLDVGGESTRPGSMPVDVQEELRRVIPVVEALVEMK